MSDPDIVETIGAWAKVIDAIANEASKNTKNLYFMKITS